MGDQDISNEFRGHPKFLDTLLTLAEMHSKKSSDYGLSDDDEEASDEFLAADPLFNFRGSVLYGIDPWVGALIRLQDKIARLQTAAAGHELTNENIIDTFDDAASYIIIAKILWLEQNEEADEPEDFDEDD